MNRREALQRVGLIMGGTIIGAEFFLSGCKSSGEDLSDLFEEDQVAFFNEVGEAILPATKTPGAKAANVGQFMAGMVRDCYTVKDQKIFITGRQKINEASEKKYGKKFLNLSPVEKLEIVNRLNEEQIAHGKSQIPDSPNHYFRMVKELTLLGYFTSEVGCTKALRYVPIPGKYVGDLPYEKGDKAFALE